MCVYVYACEIGEDEKGFLLDSLQGLRPHNDIQRKKTTTGYRPRDKNARKRLANLLALTAQKT